MSSKSIHLKWSYYKYMDTAEQMCSCAAMKYTVITNISKYFWYTVFCQIILTTLARFPNGFFPMQNFP